MGSAPRKFPDTLLILDVRLSGYPSNDVKDVPEFKGFEVLGYGAYTIRLVYSGAWSNSRRARELEVVVLLTLASSVVCWLRVWGEAESHYSTLVMDLRFA